MNGSECAGCRERDAIIAQLRMQIAQLEQRLQEQEQRLRELEARLKTNSSNSSLPPSANPPSAPKPPAKPPTGRKPGGQPGHPGHSRTRLPPERVNQVIPHVPTLCEHCQAPLPQEPSAQDPPPTWHQVIELPEVIATVTEHQGHARTCLLCGHVTRALIPGEVLAHGFGPKLTASLALLSGRCHDSKRTVEEVAQTLLDAPISLGSISNAEQEMSAALQQPYAQAQRVVQEAAVKNVDETGWSLAGKLCWMWLAATAGVAFFKICRSRSRESLKLLLGQKVRGIIGSDRFSAYSFMALALRQICWAHLKRDFQKWVDYGGKAATVGRGGLKVVDEVFALWKKCKQGELDRAGLQAALAPVMICLHEVLEGGLSCPPRKLAKFCLNVLDVYPALWTFVRVEGVEPTNNLAERMLRAGVIWRKISFGNHSEGGCRFVERVLTTVETLRLQKRQVLAYLTEAIIAHRAGQPAPSLLLRGA